MFKRFVTICFPASTTRNSRVETLRIVAILMICGMHILGAYFETKNPLNREFILFWNTIGNTGVSIFVLISGLYGIRFRLERLLNFWFLIWIYSLLLLLATAILGSENITAEALRNALFPVTSRRWWFATSYFLLFCLSPILNVAAERLGKERLGKFMALLLLLLVIVPTLTFTDPTGDNGKGTLYVIFLYLVGRYFGLYGFPTFLKEHAWLLLFASVTLIFIGGSFFSIIKNKLILDLCQDNDLLIFIEAITIVYIAQRGMSVTKWVNALAGYVFPLYLLHALFLPYWNVKPDNCYMPLYVMGKLLFVMVICVVVEMLRRLLIDKWTKLFSQHVVRTYRQEVTKLLKACSLN